MGVMVWTRRPLLALAAMTLLATAACGGGGDEPEAADEQPTEAPTTATDGHADGHGHGASAEPAKVRPLRAGERRLTLEMPEPYTPSAPTGYGTDDYRCFLLDPELDQDAWITGSNVLPGNTDVVHHVILFRVPPAQVRQAEATRRRDARARAGPASAAPASTRSRGSTTHPGWARGHPAARSPCTGAGTAYASSRGRRS